MRDKDVGEILLVEDNPRDAEMTQRALRKHNLGNRLRWIKDGADALDYLFCTGAYADRVPNRPPKLVLLDLKMSKVDGIEVLRRIRAEERTRHVPVVVMTSSSEERDVAETYRFGVNSYVIKPIAIDSFLAAVSEVGLYWVLVNRVPE